MAAAQWGTPHAGEHDRCLLEIGLLGPMRVSVDGRPLEVTAGRLRTLLALLAMAGGESVSTDRLAASLWDERLPVDVRKAVQVCVARLRAELGAEFIVTSPAGYALRAAPDQVDAVRFVPLLDAAASAASAADGSVERELLVEALTLWRGAPFEGIRSSWLEASTGGTSGDPTLVERAFRVLRQVADLDGHTVSLVRVVGVQVLCVDVRMGQHPLARRVPARYRSTSCGATDASNQDDRMPSNGAPRQSVRASTSNSRSAEPSAADAVDPAASSKRTNRTAST